MLSEEHKQKISESLNKVLSKETPELIEQIKSLIDSMSRKKLASLLNISESTLQKLMKKHSICLSPLGIKRAKDASSKLGTKLSVERKRQISLNASKDITLVQKQYIIDNYNNIPRKQIARNLGISYYLVNKTLLELKLYPNPKIMRDAQAAGGRANACKGAAAFKNKLNDAKYRSEHSQKCSDSSKRSWADEEYRLKVRNGLRKAYDDTDFKDRLSSINKERYQNDPKVREVLSAPRQFKNSKLNDDIAITLTSLGITYEREFELAWHRFDFKIGNILLEVNGDYWHGLPNNIANDRAKASLIEKYHPEFKLRTIWESEFRSIRGKQRLNEVIELAVITPTLIDINHLSFEITDKNNDVDKFLISFHYLGSTKRKKFCYTFTLHGETIAVAVFGQLIRQNITSKRALELVRLCRHPRFFNKNLLSNFLSRCERHLRSTTNYQLLVSYADTRLHFGTIYKACNWINDGLCQPDYEYMSQNNLPMHKKTLYNRAKAAGLTEREYAEINNFRKIAIGQKNRFIKNLR